VIVTGGIVTLGKKPIPGGGPQPAWLRVIPDPRLLDGSAIPPVVPNIIDIRRVPLPEPASLTNLLGFVSDAG